MPCAIQYHLHNLKNVKKYQWRSATYSKVGSGGKKWVFFGKFGVLCFEEQQKNRFACLFLYQMFLIFLILLKLCFQHFFFSLCKRLCKVFYFVVYRFICPFKVSIVFFFQKFDGTLISCLFFPEIHSNHKPVYVFCHFFLCLTVFSHSLSSFLSALLCIITFQIFHFDVVLFLCRHFFSQVCFTLFGFFPLFFPSTKYGRIYEIRVPLCILKSFLLSLLVTKASFLRKLASTL